MPVNRFTKYTPTEFMQTYDRLPFDQMFKLAQYRQQRRDAADSALDDLATNDLNLKAGYMTSDLRKQVYNDYNSQVKDLVNRYDQGANATEVLRGVRKIRTGMRQDPRLATLESDHRLRGNIDAFMKQEGFAHPGNEHATIALDAYDPLTGTFKQVQGAHNISMADYGLLTSASKDEAFKPTIDHIVPEMNSVQRYVGPNDAGYDSTNDPNGTGYYVTGTNKVLSLEHMQNKIQPTMNELNGELNNVETVLGEGAAKYVNWQKKKYRSMGKKYTKVDFENELYNYAGLRTFDHRTAKERVNGGKGSSASKKTAKQDGFFVNSAVSTTPVQNAMKDSAIAEGGLDYIAKGISENASMNDIESMNDVYDSIMPFHGDEFDSEHDSKALNAEIERIYQHRIKPENREYTNNIYGKKIPKYTDEYLYNEAYIKGQQLHNLKTHLSAFSYQVANEMPDIEVDPTTGKPLLKEDTKVYIQKMTDEAKHETLLELSKNAFYDIVSLPKKERDAILKEHPHLSKAYAHPYHDVTDLRSDKDKALMVPVSLAAPIAAIILSSTGVERVDDDYIRNNTDAIISELDGIQGEFSKDRWVDTPVGGSTVSETFSANYGDRYRDQISTKTQEITERFDKRKDFYKKLDTKIRNHYGNMETSFINFGLNTSGETQDKYANPRHQRFYDEAVRMSEQNIRIYKNGSPLENRFDKLKEANAIGGETEVNFAEESTFEPQFATFDHVNDKFFASGRWVKKVEGEDGKMRTVKSAELYQVDMTEQMMNPSRFNDAFLTSEEKAAIISLNRIQDMSDLMIPGEQRNALIDPKGKIEEKLGGKLMIGLNADGTYSLSGKIVGWDESNNPKVVDVNEWMSESGLMSEDGSVRLSQDDMKHVTSEALKGISRYMSFADNNGYSPNLQEKIIAKGGDPAKVSSIDHGLFMINDYWHSVDKQQSIANVESSWVPIEPALMTPEQNIQYAGLVKKHEGWKTADGSNIWHAADQVDGEYTNKAFANTLFNIKDAYESFGSLGTPQVRSITGMSFNFIERIKSAFGSSVTNDEGLPDWLYASAIVMGESGGDPEEIGLN